ncbi:hypothetical protein [Acinetobacter pecorum]|uniref:Immunity protein 43 domain-containing protein n=1 Tax=Acinetobacter pecorum TaxID=2762215 RepID=A0ABR8VZQ0_9GAMM|nr:hypothetical protein [Acinetobacter pecorum]MBD8010238.1 hypothetical protein [Acinetobacter pecorum]
MFKYGSKKYMHLLAEKGEVKIGTIHGYKYMEEQKKGVYDPLDGEYINRLFIDDHTFNNGNPVKDAMLRSELSPIFQGLDEIDTPIRISGIQFEDHRISPNRLVFCSSYENSVSVMKEFDAECCVQITNPKMFYMLITHEISKLIETEFMGTHKVNYGNYNRHNEIRLQQLPPELAKTRDYIGQKELRTMWYIPNEFMHLVDNDGYIFKIPQLKKFCKIVKVNPY